MFKGGKLQSCKQVFELLKILCHNLCLHLFLSANKKLYFVDAKNNSPLDGAVKCTTLDNILLCKLFTIVEFASIFLH